ncbi:hypothetical protein [Arsukibacterium sp.]|uniref:hypothetical protein n=1 Tax=Arsukibacterium sp. TaxID=1977258 RepID=UPI001BD63050|nr:hypothetical protein [Arsukibacterium sp.]MDX1537278.1 hypothetical protein [Arsukibacterium sp.]
MSKSNALQLQVLLPNQDAQEHDNPLGKIVQLWTPTTNCEQNFALLVKVSQKLCKLIFRDKVDWQSHIWDLRGFESTVSLRSTTQKSNVLFTQRSGLKKRHKQKKGDETPFTEPFSSFAKALIVTAHANKPISHNAHMVAMRALRYLYEVAELNGCRHVIDLTPGLFDEALKLAMAQGEEATTLYTTGEKLSYISDRMQQLGLSVMPINWENPIPRDFKHGGRLQSGNAPEHVKHRAEKLPKSAVLVFISALWFHYDELEERDKALTCMAVILMACGFRMDEFVSLDLNCVPSREEFMAYEPELDPQSGRFCRILKIRVLARKRYVWDSKIVPPSMTDLIFTAIDRLKMLSEEHRTVCRTLLEQGKWTKFMQFDDEQLLTSRQIMDVFGASSISNTITTLKRYGVMPAPGSKRKSTFFRVADIHKGFSDAYKERIHAILDGVGMGRIKVPVWDLITLRFKDQYTPKEMLNVFAEPLTGTQIQDFFKGRDYVSRVSKDEARMKNVFERYSFPELEGFEDAPEVRTHQFRHLLNTIMQESDMFSQEDIAKNFLRAGTRDNKAYNHRLQPEAARNVMHNVQKAIFQPRADVSVEQAATLARQFPLLTPDELTQDLESLGSSHLMDIGRCRHDYVQGPCGLHYACLHNCKHYRRTKGDPSEIARLTERKKIAQVQMERALEDAEDGFTGANEWYRHHKELVDGCNTALAIEKDSSYAPGDIVQIFPNGRDSCEV